MAYCKWHVGGALRPSALICLGYGLFALCWVLEVALQARTGGALGFWVARSTGLPALSAGFGIFLLAEGGEFRSRVVNRLSACVAAVYLITDYVPMRTVLWKGLFDIRRFGATPSSALVLATCLAALFAGCVAFELVRQLAFRLAARHRRGYWFEVASGLAVRASGLLVPRLAPLFGRRE